MYKTVRRPVITYAHETETEANNNTYNRKEDPKKYTRLELRDKQKRA